MVGNTETDVDRTSFGYGNENNFPINFAEIELFLIFQIKNCLSTPVFYLLYHFPNFGEKKILLISDANM